MAPPHILLVDDEQGFVEVMAQRLSRRGYEVDFVLNGADALGFVENDRTVDVILLDVAMPGMDGLSTLHALKMAHPVVQVLMLTGHATIASAVEAMRAGAMDYLMKPVEIDTLIAKVNEAFKRKRSLEDQLLQIRATPYISQREKEEKIRKLFED